VATLDTVVYRLIRSRRAEAETGDDRGDLLSMLLSVRDADSGERMDDMQVRDEAMTLLLAGHETTANALTWAFYLLGENPDAADRLCAEVTGALGDRTPDLDDIVRLPYATMVLEEAMRLFPPAWAIGRTAIGDDVIGGYRIRRGAGVLIAPWVVHRDPRFWEEPESFRPERFAPGCGAERPRHAYIPFSAGPRNCIGQAFAMQEGVLVLASVARRYSLAPVPGHAVIPDPVFTLRPRGGLPMVLRRVVHAKNSRYATGKV
jgi:cytochrome P450